MRQYRLTTPEQVCFSYQLAGLFTRATAYLIDVGIGALVLVGALFVVGSLPPIFGVILWLFAVFFVLIGYFMFFEAIWQGQTPGKRMMHIRVMDAGGGRLSLANIVIRNLVRMLDALPLLMFFGGITALFSSECRRLGDMAADTIVVRDRKAQLPRSVVRRQARHNSFMQDSALRNRIIARIGPRQRDLIMDLTLRRNQLDAPVRERMFSEVAGYCRRQLGLTDANRYLSDEQTVINVALILQDGWKGA